MRIKTLAGVTVGLALVLAACGDDGADSSSPVETVAEESGDMSDEMSDEMTDDMSDEASQDETSEISDESSAASAPATTAGPVETTQPAATDEDTTPQAIISLSPTATEMLYAIDAGGQVLAVDDFSNFPDDASTKMQGLSGFEPNVEAIAGLEPDLVITDGTNPDLLTQLDTLGIAHWEGPAAASFDDVYAQIEQLGAATGHIAEAAELVGNMQAEVSAIISELPTLDEPLTYYHELDPTFFSVTSGTFIGAVYEEIGLVNIADAVGEGNPYPQLNAEYIISENPDLVFLACTKYCGETADTLAARPGWGVLDAVASGGVIEMDDDIASRWGPRIVDYLRIAGEAVAEAAALQAAA